jgi:hypothetical protein
VARQQHRAAGLPGLLDRLAEDGLHEWVEPGRGLVEQEQLDVGGQRGDQRDLLPVALGVGAPLLRRIQLEPLEQLLPALGVQTAPEPAEQVDGLAPLRDGHSVTSPGT